jgi:hypothetical protein
MVACPGVLYRGGVSVLMEPRGPEPASVYWLRRAALALLVFTLLVALWWFLFGRSTSPATIQTATTSSAEEIVTEVLDEATPTEPKECAEDVIRVRARTDKKSYPAGARPELTLVIRNTGDVACLREVGPRANEMKITSGGYHVWASKHCFAGKKSNVVLLEPGQRAQTTLRWNGRTSKRDCPKKTPQAKPGSYELVASNGDVSSPKARFSLTAPRSG